MAYIGKEPIVGNFQVCDAISVVNGQAAYTMQVSSTNVVPESVNHMLVSLNGILQKPGSSFTISGSTITFASALATGDVIDFIMLLGNVLDLGVPSDATVTDAKANFVSTSSGAGLQIKGDGTTDGTLQLNCRVNSHGIKLKSPPHSAGQSYTLTFPSTAPQADKALITDGSGNLSFGDAGGGKVLQIVSGTHSTEETTSSTSFVDSSLSAQITPSATTSKVLVLISGSQRTSGNASEVFSTVFRDSSNLGSGSGVSISYTNGGNITTPICISVLDSPSSTSALTYRMKFRASGSHAQYVHAHNALSTIILMEIGAWLLKQF